jgi:peptidoglycan/xylan/chitin deacetylase (PgdA/CDA1 family)
MRSPAEASTDQFPATVARPNRLSRASRAALVNLLARCGEMVGHSSGLYRLAGRAYAGEGIIFMLHRVTRPGQVSLYPGYSVALDVLEDALQTILRMGWEAVDMDTMQRRLIEPGGSRRFVCFTFDDGYTDNLELALPLFRKYNVPLMTALLPSALDRTLFYWWGGVEEILLRETAVEVPEIETMPAATLPAGSFAEKRATFDRLDALCHRLGGRAHPFLQRMFDRYRIDLKSLLERDALSVEQARTLAGDPLVTIASHAFSHRRLSELSEEQVRREFEESRRLLEERIGVRPRHLVYPFGDPASCGPREFELARAAGYQTACTTRRGNVFRRHRDYMHCLPRRQIPLNRADCMDRLFGIEAIRLGHPRFRTN